MCKKRKILMFAVFLLALLAVATLFAKKQMAAQCFI